MNDTKVTDKLPKGKGYKPMKKPNVLWLYVSRWWNKFSERWAWEWKLLVFKAELKAFAFITRALLVWSVIIFLGWNIVYTAIDGLHPISWFQSFWVAWLLLLLKGRES